MERIGQGGQGESADQIARESQKVVLKKSTARRTAAEKARQAQQAQNTSTSTNLLKLNGSGASKNVADTSFTIDGLKPIPPPTAEKSYDAFGGFDSRRDYYVLRDRYEYPWLDKARQDPQITAGGYDVGEYQARAMLEAFAGMGCFVEEEVAGREGPGEKGVAMAAAAAAATVGDGDIF